MARHAASPTWAAAARASANARTATTAGRDEATMSIAQQWERAKGPLHRRLRLVYEGICQSVEAHFNQGLEQRKYFVDEITMTSSAICNSYVSEKSRPKGKIKIAVWNVQGHFVVKFHDSTIEPHTSITCII